jgi:hypothetical protein
MPRTLVSDWKRVATSGKTADGRTINPQDLRDMANAYDPAVYTAVIWFEHIRYLGNFGSVTEVKAEDIDGDKVALFAKLAPNDRLLQLNKEAQKLFTSIEIQPEFADTGKPYLRGLAITDDPASLGTQPLHFSRRADTGNYFAPVESLDELLPPDLGDESALNFVTRLFHQLSGKHTPKPETPPMDPKTADAFTAAVDKLDAVATRLEQVAPAPVEPHKTDVTAEQFNSLKTSLEQLQETFNTALNQANGKTIPGNTGPVTEELEPIY